MGDRAVTESRRALFTDGGQLFDTTRAWTVTVAMPSHRSEIEDLWMEFDHPQEELLDVVLDPDCVKYEYNRAFVALSTSGDVVGFGIANRCGREWLDNRIGVPAIGHRFANKNGYLHTLCVAENWREKGVGTALVRARLEWLQSHDAETVFGISWMRENGPSSSLLFEKFGFEELAHVREYYYSDEEPRRYCPDCGEPCECSAKVYGREL